MNTLNSRVTSLFASSPKAPAFKKKNWAFRNKRDRNGMELPAEVKIKCAKVGTKDYRIGNFEPAPLADVKEYARRNGARVLIMGNSRVLL